MSDDGTPVRATALSWGLKQSFRNYVAATGGSMEASGGAERAEDGVFTFAPGPDSDLTLDADGKPQGRATFVGEARFEGHGGMLSVRLVDPILEIGPSGATLSVADSPARTHRLAVAQLDMAAMTRGDDGEILIPTLLAMDGIHLLDGHYPLKTPLDPVRLRLTES
jgi:hypothetical protein